MASQGLRASPEGIRAAKTALIDKTWSQHKLAAALGITRQPVSKFFAGESVSRTCFVQICQQLGLSWQKVAGIPENVISEATSKVQSNKVDVDALVREIRQKRQGKIQDQCGTLQMLDIAQTVKLTDIYTDINVLEKINSQQWREISDLLKDFKSESNFNRLGGYKYQKRLAGLEAVLQYSKLMVLGKPGSGKTTFLQYLAIECNKGEFQPNRIAIFIRIKEFIEDTKGDSEFNLFNYISQELLSCGVNEETTNLFTQGKLLILLDGLDEIPSKNADKVTIEIRRFTQVFYRNQFVISCRIAAQQYRFPGFSEVEVADFDYTQVEVYAKNWFFAVARKSREDGEALGNLFINQLNLPENQHIRELAVTPILLHLICLVFHLKEEFPSNPAKLYEQALNILLVRWDEIRGIKRDHITHNLTLASKKNLLFQLAAINFEQGNYFFEKEKTQQLLAELHTSGDINLEVSQFQIDSEALLKAIEAQDGLLVERARGIYSFSHLTFQEYFTARKIVEASQLETLLNLVNHITEKRWHDIFLLTVNMLANADEVLQLMKQKIDLLLAGDDKLQYFLTWLHQKSSSVFTHYKAVAVRAFYLVCVERSSRHRHRAFAHTPGYNLEYALVGNIAFDPDLALDEFLSSTVACMNELDFAFEHALNDALVLDHAHALTIAFDEAVDLVIEPELKQVLQKLKKQLPYIDSDQNKFRDWWQAKGQSWSEQLRNVLIKHRNIGHNWQFNEQQKELLQQYYDANKLLVDCLNSAFFVSSAVRQKIEETLLLAIVDIENVSISCG
jgi:predicted NACHT family NTPase